MQPQQRPPNPSSWDKTAGIVEILAGFLVFVFSLVSGAAFPILLGAVIAVSGILQLVQGGTTRSTGRTVAGALGLIAGIYLMASPLVAVAVARAIVGAYLVISGILRLTMDRKAPARFSRGIIDIVLGLFIATGVFSIGFVLGLYLVIRGVRDYRAGAAAGRPAH